VVDRLSKRIGDAQPAVDDEAVLHVLTRCGRQMIFLSRKLSICAGV
jgi:hypothetical protein